MSQSTNTQYEIIHYASNYNMGDEMSDQDCQEYRNFAEKELKNEYPDYEISVVNEDNMSTCYTDDFENEEDIKNFCKELWNKWK